MCYPNYETEYVAKHFLNSYVFQHDAILLLIDPYFTLEELELRIRREVCNNLLKIIPSINLESYNRIHFRYLAIKLQTNFKTKGWCL